MTLLQRIANLITSIGTDVKALYGRSMPTGGTIGQVLTKTSSTDYAASWQTPGQTIEFVTVAATTYTIQSTDLGKQINATAATSATYTVPQLPAKSSCYVYQYGVGQVSFVAGSGVSIRVRLPLTKIAGQYGRATLVWLSATEVSLEGDLGV